MGNDSLAEQVNRVTRALTEDIKNNRLDIPSPPDILVNLRQISKDDYATASDIAEIIKQDANITARLIKVSNCALFASRFPVDTIDAAVKRLGQKKVQSLVTGLVIAQQLLKSKTKGLEDFCQLAWQASNQVAVLSYVIAKKKSTVDPEQALLAGMVHNIGTLPLIMKLNSVDELKDNPKVLGLVADVVVPKLYKKAGQLIMKNWHFPEEITFTVGHHAETNNFSENGIELNNIIQIAFQLNQLNGNYDVDAPPANLTELQTFPNFWTGWASAVLELNEMQEDIEQLQYEISH